jgi:hypothetical protein
VARECLQSFGADFLSSNLLSENIRIRIYRNIFFSIDFYGRETWSLTPREKSRLRLFGERMLMRIFGPKRVEVTRESRKLHKKRIYAPYFSRNMIRVIRSRRLRSAVHLTRMERCIQSTGGEIWGKQTTWKTLA